MEHDETTWSRWVAVAYLAPAILLPPDSLAELTIGAESARFGAVVTGLWLLKATLLAHALFFWSVSRLDTETGRIGLVAPGGSLQGATASDLMPVRGIFAVALAGLLVLAATVRLPELGAGLWFDEILTLLDHVREGPGYVAVTFDSTNQHIFYSLLASLSFAAFGESAVTLRLPAVAFGVASVWGTWWFGRRILPDREALLAAALLTLSYHHVWFSQNARGYTALLFWTLISTGLLVDMVRAPTFSWRRVAGYAIATALAVYTHVTAGALWLTHAAVAGWLLRRSEASESGAARCSLLVGLGLAASTTLLLYAPVLPQALDTLSAPTMPSVSVEWESPIWMATELARGLARGLPGGVATLAVGALVLLVGAANVARRHPVAMAAMLLPPMLVMTVALLRSHNLWPRFYFFAAGFGALVLVRGLFGASRLISEKRATAGGTLLALLLVAASAFTVPDAWGPKQDYRSADRYLADVRGPHDAVVALDMARLPLTDYLGSDYLAVNSLEELKRIEAAHRRTWIVYTFPTRLAVLNPEIWERIRSEYERVAEYPGTLRGGTLIVVRRS